MSSSGATTVLTRKSALGPAKIWLRRLGYLLLGLVLYRLLVWSALRMVDEKELTRRLDEWAERHLNADVSVLKTDADLSLGGRCRLTMHDLAIKHPNETYRGDFLFIDPASMQCPFSGLWGRECRPLVRIRNMQAHVLWESDRFEDCSLYGLFDPLEVQQTHFPLAMLNTRQIHLQVSGSTLRLTRRHQREEIALQIAGDMRFQPEEQILSGSLRPGRFLSDIAGDSEPPDEGRVELKHFSARLCRPEGKPPFFDGEFRAALQNVPARTFNVFWPGIAPEKLRLTVSGLLAREDGGVRFEGSLGGFEPETLVSGPLRIHVQQDRKGLWAPLVARCEFLNLDALPRPESLGRMQWLDGMLQKFRSIELRAGSLQLLGVTLHNTGLKLLRGNSGERAGLRLIARTFGSKDPARMPVTPLNIPAIRWNPSGGAADIVIYHTPEPGQKDGRKEPVWSSGVDLKNLIVPIKGAGSLYQAIADIPCQLLEAERLRLEALGKKLPAQGKPPLPLGSLPFREIQILHHVYPDQLNHLELEGMSPELGKLHGKGQRNADGSFTMSLRFEKIPAGLFNRTPGLSPEVRAAARILSEEEEGFRIDFSVSGKKEEVKHRYLQDIFRIWLERHSRQKDRQREP